MKEVSSKTNKEDRGFRLYELPFFNETNLTRIKILIKKFKYKEENKDKSKGEIGTRFIINTNLSKMGDLQFDGIAFEKGKKFDLIIRCENNIGKVRSDKIVEIFKKSLEAVRYIGNISIKYDEKFAEISDGLDRNRTDSQGIIV